MLTPKLEHQEHPKSIPGPLAATLKSVQHGVNYRLIEKPAFDRPPIGQNFSKVPLHLTREPVRKRNCESLLGSTQDLGRQYMGRYALENILRLPSFDFQRARHFCHIFNQRVIE